MILIEMNGRCLIRKVTKGVILDGKEYKILYQYFKPMSYSSVGRPHVLIGYLDVSGKVIFWNEKAISKFDEVFSVFCENGKDKIKRKV